MASLRRPHGRMRLALVATLAGLAALLVVSLPDAMPWTCGLFALAMVGMLLVETLDRADVKERAAALGRELRRLDGEAASRLEASRSRLSDLASVAPVGFYEADERGRWTWVSERLASLVGREADDLLGDGWRGLLEPEERARIAARWARAARAGASWANEQRLVGEDERWILLESMPRVAGDASAGHVGTLVDVTERRRRESLRQQFDQRLQHMQRTESLGDLVGGVAHDVNNLLVGILGGADLAMRRLTLQGQDGAEAPSLEELLDTIRSAANRGADLAGQLLTYTGHDDSVQRPVELGGLVDEMIALLGTSILRDSQVRHQHDGPVMVMGAPSSLCQVVANLLTNAAQASGPGGRVEVRTSVEEVGADELAGDMTGSGRAPGRYARILVDDDGPGIPEAQQHRVFEAFFTTREGGRGLGLAVVQGAVRSHAGALLVAASPAGGARISVLLPAAASQSLPKPSPVVPLERVDLSGDLLLVVDDEPSVRRVVSSMLGSCGARVLQAADAREAAEHVRVHGGRIRLVLLDIALPGVDGPTLLADLRVLHPGLNAALISGYPEAEGLERAGGNAVAGYLQKPFTADTLVQFVGRVLERVEPPVRDMEPR